MTPTPEGKREERTAAQVCVGECDHLPHGACKDCVEIALREHAEQEVETLKVDAAHMEMDLKGKLDIAREALGKIADSVSPQKSLDPMKAHDHMMAMKLEAKAALARIGV